MPLDTDVFPAVLAMLRGLTDPATGRPLLPLVSEGMTTSIAQSGQAWVTNASFAQPEWQGSDREVTDWEMDVTIFWAELPDRWNAEHRLQALIEPIRQGCRQRIKLGKTAIERAMVKSGTWSWLDVNGVLFRTVMLTLSVREKITRTYGA